MAKENGKYPERRICRQSIRPLRPIRPIPLVIRTSARGKMRASENGFPYSSPRNPE
jgi:hypothetical protein